MGGGWEEERWIWSRIKVKWIKRLGHQMGVNINGHKVRYGTKKQSWLSMLKSDASKFLSFRRWYSFSFEADVPFVSKLIPINSRLIRSVRGWCPFLRRFRQSRSRPPACTGEKNVISALSRRDQVYRNLGVGVNRRVSDQKVWAGSYLHSLHVTSVILLHINPGRILSTLMF